MRQIKFRCWTGKWFITDDFYISPEGWVGEMTSTGTYNSYDFVEWKNDWIVQQFTGLLDKHGKEIYEGDIIKDQFGECKVQWGTFGWFPFEYTGGGETSPNQCEVIGNIYENPELLNNLNNLNNKQ